jgi:hypothetical protein
MSNSGAQNASGPTLVTHAPAATSEPSTDYAQPTAQTTAPPGRRAAVNEDSSPRVNLDTEPDDSTPQSTSAPSKTAAPSTQTPQPGWPRANPPNGPPH